MKVVGGTYSFSETFVTVVASQHNGQTHLHMLNAVLLSVVVST